MLLPFESSGVDTTWELRLPPGGQPVGLLHDRRRAVHDRVHGPVRRQLPQPGRHPAQRQPRPRGRLRVQPGPGLPRPVVRPQQPGRPRATDRSPSRCATSTSRSASTASPPPRSQFGSPGRTPFLTPSCRCRGARRRRRPRHRRHRQHPPRNAAAGTPCAGPAPPATGSSAFGDGAAALFASGGLDDVLVAVSWSRALPRLRGRCEPGHDRLAGHLAAPGWRGGQSGMGEKFSPDLFTGTGNFSVPIARAGRAGVGCSRS